jgi:hypothetical protein
MLASKQRSAGTQNEKRKLNATADGSGKGRKKRKTKGKVRTVASDEDLAISSGDDIDLVAARSPQPKGEAPRRSGRARKLVAGGYRPDGEGEVDYAYANADEDIEMTTLDSVGTKTTTAPPSDDVQIHILEQSQSRELNVTDVKGEAQEDTLVGLSNPAQPVEEESVMETEPPEIELEVDEEETKPKPLLQLKYQGFNIFGNCFCVVVEPWPPIQPASRAPSTAPIFLNPAKAQNIAPLDFMPGGQVEATHIERMPLFLPDPDRGRSETPAPFNRGPVLPPVPLFDNQVDQGVEDINNDGLMEFSQALNYAGDHRGGLEDDDEMDGAVFFGDADEAREI